METLITWLQNGFYTIVPFVILLGILIFIHEFGHFIVARMNGVRVEVFSLGFGKKIFQFKRGDTTYALSAIPLGGYVKMFGEQPGEEIADADKPYSFTHKKVWQRIAVVLAGPLMNFFFAIFLFWAIAMIGERQNLPIVGDVKESAAAYAAGLRAGDNIKSVNGSEVGSWEEIQVLLQTDSLAERDMEIDVVHTGETAPAKVVLHAKAIENPNPLAEKPYYLDVEGLTSMAKGTTVGILHGSTLDQLGVKSGQTIRSVNGIATRTWKDLQNELTKAVSTAAPINMKVTELGDSKEASVTVAAIPSGDDLVTRRLGIESSELYVQKVVKDSPAEAAGLLANDRITAINDQKIDEWEEVLNTIKSSDGKTAVKISVSRFGENLDLKMTPKMTTHMSPLGTEEKRFTIGILSTANFAEMPTFNKQFGFIEAIGRGVKKTYQVSYMTIMSFVKLFQAKISPKNIGGVISIGQAASESFKSGLENFLHMMAVISVNLFVLNLLPVPVLDGGHLVFYLVEMVKGSPLSLKKMEVAQQLGLAILMSLMLFALFNDFTRVLGL